MRTFWSVNKPLDVWKKQSGHQQTGTAAYHIEPNSCYRNTSSKRKGETFCPWGWLVKRNKAGIRRKSKSTSNRAERPTNKWIDVVCRVVVTWQLRRPVSFFWHETWCWLKVLVDLNNSVVRRTSGRNCPMFAHQNLIHSFICKVIWNSLEIGHQTLHFESGPAIEHKRRNKSTLPVDRNKQLIWFTSLLRNEWLIEHCGA